MDIQVSNVPLDTTGAAVVGDWYSFRNYSHATVIIMQGAWAGGTPGVTLDQATAVAGTGTKTLGFDTMYTKVSTTADFVKTAVTSDTFDLPATANTISVIEIDDSDLDVAGGFDSFQVDIESPGANADLIAVAVIMSGAKYAADPMPDSKTDAG